MNEQERFQKFYNFVYEGKLDLLRLRCQGNALKHGLNCPMFTARYLRQNHNFCANCDHLDVSDNK